MTKWSIRALALLGLLFTPLPALSQGVGQLGSGQVWGNSTAARAPAGPTSITSILDRAISSTQGSILTRNSTVWVALNPGTAGLPLVSQGAAANLAYAILGLAGGGCNAALTASNGGILYSTASACAILPGTATARQMLQSGASAAPAWSTATWPATTTINRILFSSAANTVGEISTVNGGLLNASSSGVPGMTITPVLGVPTSSTGTLGFAGASSGTATITPQAAAGTPTLTLPNASGTFAVSASAPLALSATTGNMSITGVANAVLAGSSPAFTPTPTLGTNSGTGGQITLNGSSSGSVALRVAAAAGTNTVFQLPATNGSNTNVLQTDGSGNTSWVAAGSGTVTSIVAGSGLSGGTITGSGTVAMLFDPGSITNCTLVGTVSGNALTIALKQQDGSSDPSATAPCVVSFRNATAATGTYTAVLVTAATSFVTGATGSTFGSTNGVPFRLWITAWNNAGTVVLGVSNQSTTTTVFPLNEASVASSTACSACTNAATAGTFYTTAAQTSKAFRILGYMDWSAGLATAGTWASGPTSIQMFGPGVKKPGDVVQSVSNTTTTAGSTTSATFVALTSGQTQAITPTSTINPIRVFATGTMLTPTSGSTGLQLARGSTLIGNPIAAGVSGVAAGYTGSVSLFVFDSPQSVSAQTYGFQGKTSTGTVSYPAASTGAVLVLDEIMG